MPGWFDISSIDKLADSQYDDEKGMLANIKAVDALIQAEVRRLPDPYRTHAAWIH